MPELRTVRVAAIQATPVILDAEACVAKAVRLFEEAAGQGASSRCCRRRSSRCIRRTAGPRARRGSAAGTSCGSGCTRTRSTSRDRSSTSSPRRARRLNLHAVVAINERDGGSLYNATVTLGPNGLLHKHRKLMPTQQERLFHGIGAGDDLQPVDTAIGRIGGLICWENRMPLARWAVYQGAPQIWVAPTADDSDGWIASMRHIAIESGAFVISVPQYIPGSAFPADFPVPIEADVVYGRGGAVIVEPTWGEVIAGPIYDTETRSRGRLRPAGRAAREALVRRGGALLQDGRPLARQLTAGRRALCRRQHVRVPRPEISRPLRP